MSENVKELSEKEFDSFVKEGVVIVDFWADWCMPCRMMAPKFEAAAKKMNGKVKFAKVNVDEENELAARFQVMSIPTMILFKDKQQIKRFVGAMSEDELIDRIEEAI